MGYAALYPVNGPRPSPPRYGLIPSALLVDTAGEADRWMNGVAVWPYPDELPSGYDPCNQAATTPNVKPDGTNPEVVEFSALTVVEPVSCTSRSINDQATYVDRATVALESVEGWRVEREFWTGEILPNNPYLTDNNADVLHGGTATSAMNALAILEEAIAASGRQGWIHATPATVSVWSSMFQVYKDGPRLVTALGTIVVPGAGYDGSAPVGEAAPSAVQDWAIATGPVEIRRSNVVVVPGQLSQAMVTSTNDITFRAERVFVTDWDATLQAAVLVDRCLTTCS